MWFTPPFESKDARIVTRKTEIHQKKSKFFSGKKENVEIYQDKRNSLEKVEIYQTNRNSSEKLKFIWKIWTDYKKVEIYQENRNLF